MLNRLEMLRIFCTAAESGSFKAAAARLGISPQAVTRAIQDLERAQGELLFHRNTRGVQITAFGHALEARARVGVRQLDELFVRPPEHDDEAPRGVVRLTASGALGRHRLMPVICRLAAAYPQICCDVSLNDERADVVDERIDIGIRIGFMRDNRFVARPVAKVPFRVVAAPGLIARYGRPVTIEQLETLPTTAMTDRNTGRPWPWMFAGGRHANPAWVSFVADDADAECEAILGGVGFGQVLGFMADEHIAAGRLVVVMEDLAPEPWDLFVYRPQRGPVPARVRLVFDELVAALAIL